MKASVLVQSLNDLIERYGDQEVAGDLDAEDVHAVFALNKEGYSVDTSTVEDKVVVEFYIKGEEAPSAA